MSIMPYHQFISRNHKELSEVIQKFMELSDVYDNNVSLYLDRDTWEIFDTRAGIPVISHPFKSLNRMRSDIIQLRSDIILIYWANQRILANNKPKIPEIWSAKRLYKIYGYDPHFFTESLINYLKHGTIKEKKVT